MGPQSLAYLPLIKAGPNDEDAVSNYRTLYS